MKSEKYQQDKGLIIQQDVYQIMRKGDDCTTGCLLDYALFKDNYRLIAVDLSKQKALDDDPRAIQQILFQAVDVGCDNTKIRLCTILKQSKETVL